MKKITQALIVVLFLSATFPLLAQTFTFTSAGASGQYGPTQSQVNSAYIGTPLEGQVVVITQGIQEWTVPVTGNYSLQARGAQGGFDGGLGAEMGGVFALTQGEVLKILVGQAGTTVVSSSNSGGGGGGGSFIVNTTGNTPLLIAGGGGGFSSEPVYGPYDPNITNGNSSTNGGSTVGNGGGMNGNGGQNGTSDCCLPGNIGASGGAGLLTNGQAGSNGFEPLSFLNGGVGSAAGPKVGFETVGGEGGFGGGAGASYDNVVRSGGGGGYSGGQGGVVDFVSGSPSGGGGGSYNAGADQVNTPGANSGHGQITITLLNAPPVITCPGNFTLSNDAGVCGAVVTYTVTATDDEDGPLVPIQTAGLPSGSEFPVGTTINTFEVTDSNNNTVTCSFEVTVNDTEAPEMLCPADITQDNDPGICGAVVTFAEPTVSDNCNITGTLTFNYTGSVQQFIVPPGVTEIHAAVYGAQGGANWTDNTNYGGLVEADMTVVPGETLYIYVGEQPTGITGGWNGGGNGEAAGAGGGGASDIRIGGTTLMDRKIVAGAGGGAGFWMGEHIVGGQGGGLIGGAGYRGNPGNPGGDPGTQTSSGNGTCGSFNNPIVSGGLGFGGAPNGCGCEGYGGGAGYYGGAGSGNCRGGGGGSSYTDPSLTNVVHSQGVRTGNGMITLSFNANPSITQTAGLPSGSEYPVGITTNTFEVTDAAGNTATCSFDVTVNDTEAPMVTCQNITVELDGSGNATIIPADIHTGSTDNCGVDTIEFTETFTAFAEVNEGQDLTITLPPGNVVSAVDFASYGTPNGSNGNYTIGTCHAANSQTIVEGYALGNNTFTIPATNGVFGDPCAGTPKRLYVTVSYATTGNSLDLTCANVGANDVNLLVTDINGNTATCTAIVTVEDNEAPVITCVADATRDTDPGVCQYTVVGTEFDATFIDNCTSGIITNDLNGTTTLAGEILPKGATTVVWTVDDGNGQTATCTTVITVEDNEAPVITCVADVTRDTDPGVCEYTIVGTEFDATFTDNCADGSISNDFNGTDTLAGEVLPTGDTTVVWTVDDGNGQTVTCTTVITIADNEAPIIACPADINVNTDAGECFATASFSPALAFDNCGVDTMVQTAGLPSGSQFPVGVNTIEFTATDINGNTSICSFTITVTDNEAPVAVCQNITIQLDANGNATITAADVDGGSTDQCGVASISIDIDTFDCSHVGDNNVILSVTDVYGNVSSCTAIVTVEDVTAPVVACQNLTIELDPVTGTATILGTDIDNGSTDACGIMSYELDIDTFDCSNIGDNTVILTVTDVNGNVATCTATVTVEDNTAPELVCQDFTIEIGADGTAILDPSDVIASNDDACGIFTTAVDITEFSCADIGTPITVQVFSQDNNGNLSSCLATVTAVDVLAPVVTCPADQTVDPGAGNLFYILPDYFATGGATALDNCTDPVTNTTQDPAAGTALPDGTYTITLTAEDEYGNVGTCEFELTVDSVLGAGDHGQDLGSVTMYPNPAKAHVTIGNPQGLELEQADIYDLRGRLVNSFNLKGMANEKTMNIEALAAATYVVIIKGKKGQITKRLLKE